MGKRRRDDLDVQDRHEHAEDHDEKRNQPARRDALGQRRRGGHHGRWGGGGISPDLLPSGWTHEPGAARFAKYCGWTIPGASTSASLAASLAPLLVATVALTGTSAPTTCCLESSSRPR